MPDWCSVDAGLGKKPRNSTVRERGTGLLAVVCAIDAREKEDDLLFSRLARKRARHGATAGAILSGVEVR